VRGGRRQDDALFTLSPLGPLVDIAATTGGELADRVAEGAPLSVEAVAALVAPHGGLIEPRERSIPGAPG
jgi:hypothetical protein